MDGTIGEVQRISFVLTVLITYIFLTHQIPALMTSYTSVDFVLPREQYPMQPGTGKLLLSFSEWRSSEDNQRWGKRVRLVLARKFAQNGKPAWIGLYHHAPSHAYYWTDNSVPTYTSWAPKEPNGHSREPCAAMFTASLSLPRRATGYWNDIRCTVKYNTVCKKLA